MIPPKSCRVVFPFLLGSFLAVLLPLISSPALAWAPEGHQIVAAIALDELTPKARAAVAALLGNPGIMVLDSSWADEIRQQRPETTPWHYVNIEIGSDGYKAARDCSFNPLRPSQPQGSATATSPVMASPTGEAGNCVVVQIARDEAILSNPHASKDAKAEALRFLIHFVADLHQPLHAADHEDKGGNTELFRWHGRRVSLHQIWDQDVVVALGAEPMRVAADIDRQLMPQQKAQFAQGSVEDWTNESFHLAEREIYARLPERLPPDYAGRESGVARLQLAKAGIRLAAILNRTFR
jgi:hypothetical protein